LELIADSEITELRRVQFPLHSMASGPIAVRAGADIERHANALPRVVPRATHLGQVPARAQIPRAPFGIGLDPAGRDHDRTAMQFADIVAVFDAYARNFGAVIDEIGRPCIVADLDTVFLARCLHHGDETFAAADRLDGQSTPELETSVDFKGLTAI